MEPPQRLSPSGRALFWTLVTVTAAGRLAVALAHHTSLLANDIYQDDAFYYLKIARSLVDGRGLTFDGSGPTNAFHPLYLLSLLPVMKLSGSDVVLPIHLSAVVLAGFAVATAFVVFLLGRSWSGPGAGLAALAFWAVSPLFVVFGMNGLETGLAMLFTLAVVLLYSRWVVPGGPVATGRCVIFGVVAGLGVLARSDLLLLLAALGIDWLLALRHGAKKVAALRAATLAAAVALAVWLPWGITSRALTGHWMPLSGPASRQIALNYGWLNLDNVWTERQPERVLFDPDHPPPAYFADVATRLGFTFLLELPPLAPLRMNRPFDVWPRLDEFAPYVAFKSHPAAGLGVVVVLLGLLLRWRRPVADARSRGRRVVEIHLALVFLGYTFLSPAHWYFNRYLTPPILLATVSLVAALAAIRMRIAATIAIVVLVTCQLANLRSLTALRWSEVPAAGFLATWRQAAPLIDATSRVGAFQAGIYGWFSGRDIVNLDGKVDEPAYHALADKQLHRYIRDAGVDYILDWEWILYCLCARHMQGGDLRLQRVAGGGSTTDATLFRVLR